MFQPDNKNQMFQPDNKNYEEYVLNHIKKGTTTCALTCKDGVVLAADTRASAGFFIGDRNVMKIQKVDEHLGMTIAGGVADAQNLVDVLGYNANLYRLSTSEKFISTGSGSPVAYGYLESEYKNDLSVNEAYKVAIQAIAAAIRRNSGTGDNINAVIIDKDRYRELSKEVKDAVEIV